jgi:GNAT superfamily N-acetyltransferase
MQIQAATADQAAQLVELGPRLFANGIRAIGDFDAHAWGEEVGCLLVLDDRKAFVALENDRVVGAHIISMVTSPLAPRAPVARTTTLWVHPDARGRGAATRLQSTAEAWARDKGARLMLACVPTDYSAHADIGDADAKQATAHRFYEGRGYERAETTFLKEIR